MPSISLSKLILGGLQCYKNIKIKTLTSTIIEQRLKTKRTKWCGVGLLSFYHLTNYLQRSMPPSEPQANWQSQALRPSKRPEEWRQISLPVAKCFRDGGQDTDHPSSMDPQGLDKVCAPPPPLQVLQNGSTTKFGLPRMEM